MALMMGSAKLDITPRAPCHLAGYGSRNKPHEGVHDRIMLRALFARGAGGAEVVLISADILWFGQHAADRIRAALKAELGVKPACAFIAGTHTHSAPATMGEKANEEWLSAAESQALAAAALAKDRLKPVRLSLCRGSSHIGINRRERKPDGSISLGKNPEGPADRELIAVAADDEQGRPVARVLNFGCHGVVLGPGNYQVSADWCGSAASRIEEQDGCPALFFNGGAGNVDPRVRVQNEFGPVAEVAGEFMDAYASARKAVGKLPDGDKVAGVEHTVRLPRKLRDVEDGKGRTRAVPLRAVRIGPLRLVGYPGEMFCETAMAVKRRARGCSLVCSYVDAGEFGYVPVQEAFDDGGYEPRSTPYSEHAEAVLRKGLVDALAGL